MKPNFVCIGAQKAGTSWLYRQLKLHPEFAMPTMKEIHYFDRSDKYPSSNKLYRTRLLSRLKDTQWLNHQLKKILRAVKRRNFVAARWYWRYYFANYSDEWYISLFDFAQGKLTGDMTPSYAILDDGDVQRLFQVAGNPKIIFMLRNPIERAWSMWRFEKTRRGQRLNLKDTAAIKAEMDSPGQELRSNYKRTLDIYSKYFDAQQLLIGFYDAISRDPDGLMSAVLKHVGAEDLTPNPQVMRQHFNVSKSAAMPESIREYLTMKYGGLIEYLGTRLGSYAEEWLQELQGYDVVGQIRGHHHPPIVYL